MRPKDILIFPFEYFQIQYTYTHKQSYYICAIFFKPSTKLQLVSKFGEAEFAFVNHFQMTCSSLFCVSNTF